MTTPLEIHLTRRDERQAERAGRTGRISKPVSIVASGPSALFANNRS